MTTETRPNQPPSHRMNESLTIGAVELAVASLGRSVDYYTHALGMQVLSRDGHNARLGVPGRTLAVLRERPGAVPAPLSSAGLSHFAPQVPTPADLARFVKHYTADHSDYQLTDHLVAHSCYVTDPDGYTIEVTCARPRDEWRWQDGHPAAVADPLSPQRLADEPGADLPFEGLPATTEMGHVQLKVTDPGLTSTEPFYCDLLGFDVEGRLGNLFLAVGVVTDQGLLVLTNRFSSDSAEPAPDNSAHLLGIDLLLPTMDEVRTTAEALAAADYPHELTAELLQVRDPSGNLLRFRPKDGNAR